MINTVTSVCSREVQQVHAKLIYHHEVVTCTQYQLVVFPSGGNNIRYGGLLFFTCEQLYFTIMQTIAFWTYPDFI